MERAKHYSAIKKHQSFTAADRDAVLAAVPPEILAFLEKRKIGKIEFLPNDILMGNSNGRYRTSGREMRINSSRAAASYGNAFTRGIPSVSTAGADAVDAMRRTLMHEIGHHIYFSAEETFSPLSEAALQAGNPITALAATVREEYFAECFAAYYFQRLELQKDDPTGYDMVEDVLRKAGVLK